MSSSSSRPLPARTTSIGDGSEPIWSQNRISRESRWIPSMTWGAMISVIGRPRQREVIHQAGNSGGSRICIAR